jgi:hypothetical protein
LEDVVPAFLFHCPNTGRTVQGLTDETPDPTGARTYISVECLACRQVHLVNLVTGKLLGSDDDD